MSRAYVMWRESEAWTLSSWGCQRFVVACGAREDQGSDVELVSRWCEARQRQVRWRLEVGGCRPQSVCGGRRRFQVVRWRRRQRATTRAFR